MSKSKAKPAAKSTKPKTERRAKGKAVEATATIVEPTAVDTPAVVVEAPAPEDVVTTIEQNGIKRPRADTLCGRVFKVLDDLRAAGVEPTAKNAAAAFEGVAISPATIRTQTQRWRKYISG